MPHEEVEITSTWSLKLAFYNHLINGLESIIAEYGCSDVGVTLLDTELPSLEFVVCYSNCDEVPHEGFELNNILEYGLAKEYTFRYCREGLHLNDLYSKALDLYLSNVLSYLHPYSIRTAIEGIEYMLLVLKNGRAVLIEGEKDKVIVPSIKLVASAHTHPKNCIPSPHDLRSIINILLEGGLGASVVSPNCTLTIFRNGPFTEDDLIAITTFMRKLRKSTANDIASFLTKNTLGRNLKVITSY